MVQKEIKAFLERCSMSDKKADYVFPNLAKMAKFYYVPTSSSDFSEVQRFIQLDDGKKYAVIFTDIKLAEEFCKNHSYKDNIQEVSAVEILKGILALRNIEGLSLNFKDKSQLVLNKKLIRLLFREYLLQEFYIKGGAWCLFKNRSYVTYEVAKGIKSIPIFAEKEEALRCRRIFKEKATVEFLTWRDIIDFTFKTKLEYLIYAPDAPHVTFLKHPYFSWLYESASLAMNN
ncbi:hypothetical protein NL50_00135 [Clostridium acetobutylicum]|nr:hypothetical protein NL50_00135 [Clostridium acetobutylicum]